MVIVGLHSEAALNRKFAEFALLMNHYLNHFPKHEKYALCQEIRKAAYEVYGYIVEAQKRYHKKTTLTNLDIRHEQLRMLFSLAFELGYFSFQDGATPEAIVQRYSTLALADVYAVVAYYLRHRSELDEYLAQREQTAERVRRQIESGQRDLTEIRDRIAKRQGPA